MSSTECLVGCGWSRNGFNQQFGAEFGEAFFQLGVESGQFAKLRLKGIELLLGLLASSFRVLQGQDSRGVEVLELVGGLLGALGGVGRLAGDAQAMGVAEEGARTSAAKDVADVAQGDKGVVEARSGRAAQDAEGGDAFPAMVVAVENVDIVLEGRAVTASKNDHGRLLEQRGGVAGARRGAARNGQSAPHEGGQVENEEVTQIVLAVEATKDVEAAANQDGAVAGAHGGGFA